ncbi:hypothetical protein C5167_029862 [Papaver somniferum]|nr:hypothetical protein C5167_029862 [Papaver somniferum]
MTGAPSSGLFMGILFIDVGFLFKITVVPFHMWAPDIYEGSPTPVTAFLSIAPKISISANMSRLSIYGSYGATLQQIFFFCSIASMILGALAAMAQTKVKRLLAHSLIGHVGKLRRLNRVSWLPTGDLQKLQQRDKEDERIQMPPHGELETEDVQQPKIVDYINMTMKG